MATAAKRPVSDGRIKQNVSMSQAHADLIDQISAEQRWTKRVTIEAAVEALGANLKVNHPLIRGKRK